jgi:hypothetical protein
VNDYDKAIGRLEHLRAQRDTLRRRLEAVEQALDGAYADLAACEQSPGIPKAEYRPRTIHGIHPATFGAKEKNR